jgi:hypothetical protein
MALALRLAEELETLSCGKCGIEWAMPARFIKARREDGQTFYCPNGDPRCYRDSETDKLRRKVDALERGKRFAEERATREKRRAAAARGQVTKLRNRVGNGVCPCCNRSFTNLRRHMASKHPEFKSDEGDGGTRIGHTGQGPQEKL